MWFSSKFDFIILKPVIDAESSCHTKIRRNRLKGNLYWLFDRYRPVFPGLMSWLWRRVSSGAWRRPVALVSVPAEMQIKALRWCSSNSRAVGCTLACHRCLWISASSRNRLHWSQKRSPPIHSFISQHAASAFTTHSFHSHSFSLWQMEPQQQVLTSSLIVRDVWCPAQRHWTVSPLSSMLPLQPIHQFCICLRERC